MIEFKPIGIIHTPHKKLADMPIQSIGAQAFRGEITVFDEYAEGLKDLDGFSHIALIYHFHKTAAPKLSVVPFLDSKPRGVFATRAPTRPNPIGLSVVRLLGIDGTILNIQNVDILDGTPLIDIKPYIPQFDIHPADRIGWLEYANGAELTQKSDNRFAST